MVDATSPTIKLANRTCARETPNGFGLREARTDSWRTSGRFADRRGGHRNAAVSAPKHTCAALAAAAVAVLASGCGGGNLSAHALSQESKSLKSLAAEGALLARSSAAGRTTHVYTRVHSEYLQKAASKSATSLQSAKTTAALEPELERLASTASKVSADLKQLGHAPKDEQRRIARQLEASAKALG